jgi:hypothetical protein
VSPEVLGERTADHHLHQIGLGERRRGPCRDVAPIAQDRDLVAQLEDLRHAMRHVDARHAARLQPLDQREQSLRLG